MSMDSVMVCQVCTSEMLGKILCRRGGVMGGAGIQLHRYNI